MEFDQDFDVIAFAIRAFTGDEVEIDEIEDCVSMELERNGIDELNEYTADEVADIIHTCAMKCMVQRVATDHADNRRLFA